MGKLSKAFPVLLALLAVGCASGGDRDRYGYREPVNTYDRDRIGSVQHVQHGRIVSLTPVAIEGNESKLGTVLGAVAGGLAGRQFGSGSGRDIMTVVGAVAGGYAGSRMQDGATEAEAVEIGLEMDDGREISIIQELDENEMFRVGDHVSVVFNGDKARVEN